MLEKFHIFRKKLNNIIKEKKKCLQNFHKTKETFSFKK